MMVSEMKSGPSIKQMVIRAPAFLGLPAERRKQGEGERENDLIPYGPLYILKPKHVCLYFHTPLIKGKGQELSKSLETGTRVQDMYI